MKTQLTLASQEQEKHTLNYSQILESEGFYRPIEKSLNSLILWIIHGVACEKPALLVIQDHQVTQPSKCHQWHLHTFTQIKNEEINLKFVV